MPSALAVLAVLTQLSAAQPAQQIPESQAQAVAQQLAPKFPDSEHQRLERGVRQAARMWRSEDGSPEAFKEFCASRFYSGKELDALFDRLEAKLEALDGHLTAMRRELNREQDESRLPPHPADELFAALDPGAHLIDDLFQGKLAFVVLLNFPLKTLEECRTEGPSWTPRQWAEVRLAQRFRARVPASVNQEIAKVRAEADAYVYNYNIQMDRVLGPDSKPAFPEGKKLISHWGLRDEITGLYSDPKANLWKQDLIYSVMERIIRQEIPKAVLGEAKVLWDPAANTLTGPAVPGGPYAPGTAGSGTVPAAEREPDTRYEKWLAVARVMRLLDPFYPDYPSHVERSFRLEREMSEDEVEKLLTDVLSSKAGKQVADLVRKRLGRDLRPFDIWYGGFKPGAGLPEAELDKLAAKRFPDVAAFERAIPDTLRRLGFDRNTAGFLAAHIEVDPARGAGHAMGANMRGDKSHLRTRVPAGGMDYKGFNTAMHELGHCVEQTFSLNRVSHTLMQGVPNNAITEAFAFVFQGKDLQVLGVAKPSPADEDLRTLQLFWNLREISGVALVELRAWRWIVAHPDAAPAALREELVRIATEVWNEYYAPAFGVKDSPVLAIYAHMVNYALYLPNYPIGYIVASQVEDYFKSHPLAKEMERQCSQGTVTPDLWMLRAVGSKISAGPILDAAGKAAGRLKT